MAQKIVIPKGTINPGETTVIEIPQGLQGSSVVVAKPKEHGDESSFEIRDSFLQSSQADYSETFSPNSLWTEWSMLKSMVTIYEKRDITKFNELEASLKRKSKGYKPKKSAVLSPKDVIKFLKDAPNAIHLLHKGLTDVRDKAKRRYPNLFGSPGSANFQPEERTPPQYEGPYDSQLMGNASWGSSPRNVQRLPTKRPDARLPMLPYPSDFSPRYRSSPVNRDQWTIKDYNYNPESFVAPINAKYPELPHYDPAFLGTPRKIDFELPDTMVEGDGPQLPGASQLSEAAGGMSTAVHEKMKALDQTEYVEQWQILADLRMYQHTRRKLIYDICNMGTGSVTAKSKMSRIMAPIKSVFGKKGKYTVNPYA